MVFINHLDNVHSCVSINYLVMCTYGHMGTDVHLLLTCTQAGSHLPISWCVQMFQYLSTGGYYINGCRTHMAICAPVNASH